MQDILRLISLDLKSYVRKLLYDFSREFVIIISTGVLSCLFFYIFNDFIGDKLKNIPKDKVDVIATYVAIIFSFVAHFFWYKLILANKLSKSSLYITFLRMGQNSVKLNSYLVLSFLLECCLFFAIFDYMINRWIHDFPLDFWYKLETVQLMFIPISYFLNSVNESKEIGALRTMNFKNTNKTLTLWRLYQIIFRNRASQISLLLSSIIALTICGLCYLAYNTSALVLLSMMVGLFNCLALSFQLQEDMSSSWLEKIIGISQNQIESTYFRLGMTLCLPSALLFVGFTYFSTDNMILALQLLGIALTGPLCFSSIMFQIDPRRPLIQVLSSTLIILFIGTAIFAHPLAIILNPILIYYGKNHQTDQFYSY